MDLPCYATDIQLFQACTKIKLGNGQKNPLLERQLVGQQMPKRHSANPFQTRKEKK